MSGVNGLRVQRTVQCMEANQTEGIDVDVRVNVPYLSTAEITAKNHTKKKACVAMKNTVQVRRNVFDKLSKCLITQSFSR